MNYLPLLPLITLAWVSIHVLISNFTTLMKSFKYPSGPHPFPIIGNILELGSQPHQALTNIFQIYGPIMRQKLGNTTTIVISYPQVAKEVLQKNDQIHTNRIVPELFEHLTITYFRWHGCHLQHNERSLGELVLPKCSLLSSLILRKFFAKGKCKSWWIMSRKDVRKVKPWILVRFHLCLIPYQTHSSQWVWLITHLISLKSSRTSFKVSWKKLEGLTLGTSSQSFGCLIHKACREEWMVIVES